MVNNFVPGRSAWRLLAGFAALASLFALAMPLFAQGQSTPPPPPRMSVLNKAGPKPCCYSLDSQVLPSRIG